MRNIPFLSLLALCLALFAGCKGMRFSLEAVPTQERSYDAVAPYALPRESEQRQEMLDREARERARDQEEMRKRLREYETIPHGEEK